jgi:hypothetical protein
MPLAKCVKKVSPTLKNVDMNRMNDFKNTFKPLAYVLHFAWNNQNLALPIEDVVARVSTVTLCLYFLACYPCASLANSFITTTLHSPPLTSTAGLAYIITTCHSAPLVCTRWSSIVACIITISLSLCATCLHSLKLYSSLHHNHLSVTPRHLSPPAEALQ